MVSIQRKRINREIGILLKPIYFNEIPLGKIDDIIRKHGFFVADEEGNPWSGFLCGREGTVRFDIYSIEGKLSKYGLSLQWYKMNSGRYEITSYVG